MIYQESKKYSREEVEKIILNNKFEMIPFMLVGVALNEPDLNYAYSVITKFLDSPNIDIVGVSIICLAHLARIHGNIYEDETLIFLRKIIKSEIGKNSIIMGRIGDAAGDFSVYQPELYNRLIKEFPDYFKDLGF